MSHDKFAVAQKIADAAFALDEAKGTWPGADQLWYLGFVEKMYAVAETLAGDRVEELYESPPESEETHL